MAQEDRCAPTRLRQRLCPVLERGTVSPAPKPPRHRGQLDLWQLAGIAVGRMLLVSRDKCCLKCVRKLEPSLVSYSEMFVTHTFNENNSLTLKVKSSSTNKSSRQLKTMKFN